MQLTEYVDILRRRGWVMLLLALVTAASALVFSRLQTPVYESSVFILVQPARTDFGLAQSAKLLLRSYVSWMKTQNNAREVIDLLQMDTTPETLLGSVTIDSDDSRFIIQIDVKNENGDLANDIAQKWADVFVQWRGDENAKQRKEDRVDALILDAPRYVLDQPKTSVNVLAGGILGLLIGGAIVFWLEYLESGIVRSPQDVERGLGMNVLGSIPAFETGASGSGGRKGNRS